MHTTSFLLCICFPHLCRSQRLQQLAQLLTGRPCFGSGACCCCRTSACCRCRAAAVAAAAAAAGIGNCDGQLQRDRLALQVNISTAAGLSGAASPLRPAAVAAAGAAAFYRCADRCARQLPLHVRQTVAKGEEWRLAPPVAVRAACRAVGWVRTWPQALSNSSP